MAKSIFHRTELLVGKEKLKEIAAKRVIIFGIGGVGSWCAESLVRSGIVNLTIVDSDIVDITNVNRQLQATTKTVGMPKTEVLKQRLLEINPDANITIHQKIYCEANYQEFELSSYDFIVDAIDTLSNKIHLIRTANQLDAVFISSMGAALKIDPTRVKVEKFWKVQGCALARILRKKIRKVEPPIKDFLCVCSDELLENAIVDKDDEQPAANTSAEGEVWQSRKAVTNGAFAHITAIYGFTIAGLIMKEVCDKQFNK